MNYLAHLFLSDNDAEARLGNLLGDFIKQIERDRLNLHLEHGIACHQIIDTFTDRHSQVHISKQRIRPPYARFAGILVDLFYDHFLARHWATYSAQPLSEFVIEVYSSFSNCSHILPDSVRITLDCMASQNWLESYYEISGIEAALERISARMRYPVMLSSAMQELTSHYDAFQDDFLIFFPEVSEYVKAWRSPHSIPPMLSE